MICNKPFTRRAFLLGSAAALAPFAANEVAAANSIEHSELVHTELTIPIESLPSEFESYRIGFFSDVHLGSLVPHEWVDHVLAAINQKNLDLLLLGGDYISYEDTLNNRDNSLTRNHRVANYQAATLARRLLYDFTDLIKQVRPRDGIVAITGNHDRFVDLDHTAEQFHKAGAVYINNNSHTIARGRSKLEIYGVDDLWYGMPKLPQSTKRLDDTVRILLSHNPDFFSSALGVKGLPFDLALAGHTHGGQIRLPLIGAVKTNAFDHRFLRGLAQVGMTHTYTTQGVGVSTLPWRFNCPPEICVFTLKS